MQNYSPLPVAFDNGQGAWLWDRQGNKYLDALAGIAVCTLGHAHPRLAQAIAQQAEQLLHCSNIYQIPAQEKLAEKLCELSGMRSAFFCNSGTEANEAAIKLARLHGHKQGIKQPKIIVTEGAFHGRTMAALSATASKNAKVGFGPMMSGFKRVPFGNLEALQKLARERDDIAAILIEPIQGEGGINIPPDGYLKRVRRLCDEAGWLMILDEIQTGVGRTGRWFAFQHEHATPDIMTLAKGLGGGMPIGACLARGKAAALFAPGSHGSTFGGNPLACRAALTVLETLESEKLVKHAETLGGRLLRDLNLELDAIDAVVNIRGRGLMLGIELDRPCGVLVQQALDDGLLINVTAGNVIRLLPPLILDDTQARIIVKKLAQLIRAFIHCDTDGDTHGDKPKAT